MLKRTFYYSLMPLLQCSIVIGLVHSSPGAAVSKKKYDFIVGVDGDFKQAMSAASKNASSENRFYIFFPNREYNIGSLTGDGNQKTTFSTSHVSLIGQNPEKSIIYNKSKSEGLRKTATLKLAAGNLYLQDITILNKANYGQTGTYDNTTRHAAVEEGGKQIIYKNVRVLSTQDTYVSSGSSYWEGGELHGTTDFICGRGNVYFNGTLLYVLKKSFITAAWTGSAKGYVFNNCVIDGRESGYYLGRSWNNAKVVFLNTTMKKLPVQEGWGDPMRSDPIVFAEYNSRDSSGNLLDLSQRRSKYNKATLNPVLSESEIAKYTVDKILAGWDVKKLTKQIPAPEIKSEGGMLTWDNNPDALCWVVFKNGLYHANITENRYDPSPFGKGDSITVRAANAMGGLGAESGIFDAGTGKVVRTSITRGSEDIHISFNTRRNAILVPVKGAPLRSFHLCKPNGGTLLKYFTNVTGDNVMEIPVSGLENGIYFYKAEFNSNVKTGRLMAAPR